MSQKKHPLEIFRKHGAFSEVKAPNEGGSNVRKGSGTKTKNNTTRKTTNSKRVTERKKSSGLGDKTVTFSLNVTLFFILGMLVISVGAYFIGFQKGKGSGARQDLAALKQNSDTSTDNLDYNSQSPSNKEIRSNESDGYAECWGIQVGTWSNEQKSKAEEVRVWLKEKGHKLVFSTSTTRGNCIIIVGSFLDKDNPKLERLKEELQAIDDYPFGDKSPFEGSLVRKYYRPSDKNS